MTTAGEETGSEKESDFLGMKVLRWDLNTAL
jgi:hypothetical protein